MRIASSGGLWLMLELSKKIDEGEKNFGEKTGRDSSLKKMLDLGTSRLVLFFSG